MKKSTMNKEIEVEFRMIDLFRKLDEGLMKGKLALNMSYSYKTDHFMRHGRETQTIKIYEFGNGVSIAQERYVEHGSESVRVTGFPECRYEDRPYSEESTFYFVFKEGKPVVDKEEAKALIHQATGIKLPRLDIPRPKRSLSLFSLDLPDFGGYYEVITDFDIGKKPDKYESSLIMDEQPDEEDIARQLRDVVEKIDSLKGVLKDEFGLERRDVATGSLKELRSIAYKLYQQYKSRLPKYARRLGERRTFEALDEE